MFLLLEAVASAPVGLLDQEVLEQRLPVVRFHLADAPLDRGPKTAEQVGHGRDDVPDQEVELPPVAVDPGQGLVPGLVGVPVGIVHVHTGEIRDHGRDIVRCDCGVELPQPGENLPGHFGAHALPPEVVYPI